MTETIRLDGTIDTPAEPKDRLEELKAIPNAHNVTGKQLATIQWAIQRIETQNDLARRQAVRIGEMADCAHKLKAERDRLQAELKRAIDERDSVTRGAMAENKRLKDTVGNHAKTIANMLKEITGQQEERDRLQAQLEDVRMGQAEEYAEYDALQAQVADLDSRVEKAMNVLRIYEEGPPKLAFDILHGEVGGDPPDWDRLLEAASEKIPADELEMYREAIKGKWKP